MDSDTKEEFDEIGKRLMEAFEEFDRALRSHDRQEWERWKAGGKAVSDDFVSMYPSAEGILNTISETEADEEEDEDEEEGEDKPLGTCPSCGEFGTVGEGCPTCPGFWYSETPDEDIKDVEEP